MLLYPNVLILLLLIPLAIVSLLWAHRQRINRLNQLGDLALIQSQTTEGGKSATWRSILWLVALTAIIIALARPVWGTASEAIQAENVALMVVLDVSKSMDAEDIQPSRLERAKLTARTLFEARDENLVSLILFAGDAIVQFPLTSNINLALTFVDAASTDSITRQGTATEAALRLALDTVDERITARTIIVLMSDGENHEGVPQQVAQAAAERGIIIHAVGFGTADGATIPVREPSGEVTGAKTDSAGNVVVTRLNPEPLQAVAEATGGIYREASSAGIETIDLLQEIDTVIAETQTAQQQIRQVDRFGLFLSIAVFALTLDLILSLWRPEAPDVAKS
ncbi:MAG: VWA domain-containing protein [Chloroflexota bacterium]